MCRYILPTCLGEWLQAPIADCYLKAQNQNESDLSHQGDLSDIICGHFDEKNEGTHYPRLGLSSKNFLLVFNMDLKPTVYVGNVIFLKPKTRWNTDILWIFKHLFLLPMSKAAFLRSGLALWCPCDVIRWMFVLILVSMEERDPELYCPPRQKDTTDELTFWDNS